MNLASSSPTDCTLFECKIEALLINFGKEIDHRCLSITFFALLDYFLLGTISVKFSF